MIKWLRVNTDEITPFLFLNKGKRSYFKMPMIHDKLKIIKGLM